jgi:hypothetical protein
MGIDGHDGSEHPVRTLARRDEGWIEKARERMDDVRRRQLVPIVEDDTASQRDDIRATSGVCA